MLRLIIQTVPVSDNLDDQEPTPTFNVYEVECASLERHLSSPVPALHRRVILGYEVYEKPKEPDKPAPGSLAEKLAKYKAEKASKEAGQTAEKNGFSKWEKKAEEARKKEAANKKKQEEAKKAKGYQNGKTSWWRRQPATT